MAEEDSSKSCSTRNPSGLFQPEEAWKGVPLSISAQTTPSNYVFLEKRFNENLRSSSPSNLFAPSRNLPIRRLSPLFSFPLFFPAIISTNGFETTTRSIFKAGSISREPPRFFRRRRMRTISGCANSFLPRGWMDRNFAERNEEWEECQGCLMFSTDEQSLYGMILLDPLFSFLKRTKI